LSQFDIYTRYKKIDKDLNRHCTLDDDEKWSEVVVEKTQQHSASSHLIKLKYIKILPFMSYFYYASIFIHPGQNKGGV